jgi:hypothetical protein
MLTFCMWESPILKEMIDRSHHDDISTERKPFTISSQRILSKSAIPEARLCALCEFLSELCEVVVSVIWQGINR